jgi:ankyrin repeat protein
MVSRYLQKTRCLSIREDKAALESGDKMHSMQMGRTPLHVAAANGNHGMLSLFVSVAETVNIGDKHGHTPLHACVSNFGDRAAKLRCMEVLLEQSDVMLDAVDSAGCTCLHHASDIGNVKAVKLIVKHGCSIVEPGPVCITTN